MKLFLESTFLQDLINAYELEIKMLKSRIEVLESNHEINDSDLNEMEKLHLESEKIFKL